ncbi:MAG: DinB family protein [Candidatus Dormibacteria bacterium]
MAAPNSDPSLTGDERACLGGFLEDQRGILAWKCSGLSEPDLKRAAVPPSKLTLLGLVRHLAEVERVWFRTRLAGEAVGPIWRTEDSPDADFEDLDDADVGEAWARWRAECEVSRSILAGLDSLDYTFSTPKGLRLNARAMLNHMIEEYARHNGHADLLRERIDGQTGESPPEPERAQTD